MWFVDIISKFFKTKPATQLEAYVQKEVAYASIMDADADVPVKDAPSSLQQRVAELIEDLNPEARASFKILCIAFEECTLKNGLRSSMSLFLETLTPQEMVTLKDRNLVKFASQVSGMAITSEFAKNNRLYAMSLWESKAAVREVLEELRSVKENTLKDLSSIDKLSRLLTDAIYPEGRNTPEVKGASLAKSPV